MKRWADNPNYKAQSSLSVHAPVYSWNNNWTQYSNPTNFWHCSQDTEPVSYDLFILLSVGALNQINRNISENRHNLKTLRLL